MYIRILWIASLAFMATTSLVAQPPHVLVWDERQPRQSEAYENFLGNEIVTQLKARRSNLEFRSVTLDDPDQGLSAGNLEWADVIVWWGACSSQRRGRRQRPANRGLRPSW